MYCCAILLIYGEIKMKKDIQKIVAFHKKSLPKLFTIHYSLFTNPYRGFLCA
jgi:hypothetical protein